MTPLGKLIAAQIAAQGPITLAEYMTLCLGHPTLGYYTTRDPLGVEGDFTTAPEISQMFGELTGLALAQSWLDQGAPSRFVLAELGPGRGTLMADILRATRVVPGFHAAASLHLVETSPTLRASQANALNAHTPTWHNDITQLPDGPLFLVANEFFDALPIRQFRREGDGWREHLVGLEDGTLQLGQTAPAPLAALEHRLKDTQDGEVVETCAPACALAADIGARIEAQGGGALIFDYGDWRSRGDTFQAVAGHKATNPFAAPGEADLTAHVDFEAIALAAAPAKASQMTPMGTFLERLGIAARAQALAKGLSGKALESHLSANRRLTHPDEMGSVFKVLGLTPSTQAPLAGLMHDT